MKILVTGATGNVGSEVVRQLSVRGIPVAAAVRNIEKAKKQLPSLLPAELRNLDFGNETTWPSALREVGHLYLVLPPGLSDAGLVERFFKTALDAGVRQIVFNSGRTTGDLEGEPLHVTENLLRNSGIDWTILRPGWFMQNFLNWIGFTIPSESAFYAPAADSKTAFVDVRDLAAVAASALTSPGHVGKCYDITSPEALDHYEVAAIISEAAGRTIRFVHLSDEEYVKAMTARGWTPEAAAHTVFLYRIVRMGKEAGVSDDTERLLERKGIDFRMFAKEHAAFW